MNDKKTISIAPAPKLIQDAFEHFGIELGGALQITPTGDFRIDSDAPDYASVLSKLTGQILADYASGTMVIPSNVEALQGIEKSLGDIRRRFDFDELTSRQMVDEVQERLQGVITNLDGLLGS